MIESRERAALTELPGIVVRPAIAEDADAVVALHMAAYEDTFLVSGADLDAARADKTDRWRGVLARRDPDWTVLAATRRGAVVGFCASHPCPQDRACTVHGSLYVAPAQRGAGIGCLLLCELGDRLDAVGRGRMRVNVMADNVGARRLYERLGAAATREQTHLFAGRSARFVDLAWPSARALAVAARKALADRRAAPLALRAAEAHSIAGAPHPAGEAGAAALRVKQRLGPSFGLSQFGVNRLTLAPGAHSAPAHAHSHEDEFVFVLDGEVALVVDGEEQRLQAGDCAGFAGGSGRAHHLENRGETPAVVLEIGARLHDRDGVVYPGRDLTVDHVDGRRVYRRADGTVLGGAD
jgi:uncharacterized cupin superfamily protein/ribosomal protein S18 acetylase RimI-like enzyme